MLRIIIFLITCCYIQSTFSQNACGIINTYYKVVKVDTCSNQMTVNSIGLVKGDRVVIIQMNGATAQLGNTASFGSLTSMNNVGNYEFNVVSDVVSDTEITFSLKFLNQYDPTMALQLVRFPAYRNVNTSCLLTCAPWNGQTGGVLVLFATDTIRMQSKIDVSGKGFRGSVPMNAGNCLPLPYTNYFTTAVTNFAGRKGEGIVPFNTAYECGRGKYGNAGGGGNEHNSGGGGGANYGNGGDGGERIKNILSCPGNYPGVGGQSLSGFYNILPKNRIFMGASGGCGHENNNFSAVSGSGGGIVFIITKIIKCNNDTIISNGSNVTDFCNEDGGSGGGAGGTIIIKADSVYGKVFLKVKGGFGQSVDNSGKNECYGPGGGGGGGVILSSFKRKTNNTVNDTSGGVSGITYNSTGTCNNTPNSATNGAPGKTYLNYVYNESPIIFRKFSVTAGADLTICKGDSVQLSANQGKTFEWFPNYKLSNYKSKNPTASPDTSTTYIIKAFDSCSYAYDTVRVNVLQSPLISHTKDTTLCYGDTLQLFVTGGTSYTWSPPISISNINISNPKVWPSTDSKYVVKVSNGGCYITDTIRITIVQSPIINLGKDTLLCLGDKLTLHATGATTYKWSPDSFISDINSANPEITATKSMTYFVTGYNVGGCFGFSKINILVDSCKQIVKPKSSIIIPNVFTPNDDGVNDFFELSTENITDVSIVIFNRWGQTVFTSDKTNFKWDGVDSPAGIYYFKLFYTDLDKKKNENTGVVTLIR